ncbi:hypothetical protein JCM33774_31590 [Actinophytocola sp. KF-1]
MQPDDRSVAGQCGQARQPLLPRHVAVSRAGETRGRSADATHGVGRSADRTDVPNRTVPLLCPASLAVGAVGSAEEPGDCSATVAFEVMMRVSGPDDMSVLPSPVRVDQRG